MKRQQERRAKVFRPGKTREDAMPTGQRPRVQAAELRREKPNHMRGAPANRTERV